MSFPPAHMLIGAGLAEVAWSASPRVLRWKAWTVAALVAALPDVDLLIGWASHRGPVLHGTFTHSLAAVVVCTLLAIGLAGPRWGVYTALGYGSHLLVDLLDSRGTTNVALGWPFTRASSSGLDALFQPVPVETSLGLEHAIGSVMNPTALRMLLEQTALAAAIFVALLAVGRAVRLARARWLPIRPAPRAADEPDLSGGAA
ncbi:MAG: LexA-binding, inner rane-associated putative hydrolase [Gemmatimonadetes bacterium]|nr:LexA-binding, inner rane-associated putative hydrolase [Gemmatimonadota bacterium]